MRCSRTGWYESAQLVVAGAWSNVSVSQSKHEQQELPLASYIHLTCDFEERRRMLMEIKPQKLQAAEEFLHDHYQHLDLLRPYAKKGQFENAQGDYCTTRVEIVQFEGVKSVREVFDAALYSSANLEIMVSEKLGHLTLREEYDTLDEGTWNARLLSSDPQGIKQEMNVVSFAQFRADHYVKGCELPECGVIVTDVVDKDDLYPYKPNDNLRRDVSVMVMMTPHRRPRMQQHSTHAICEDMVSPDGEGELVVVLQHIVFEKLHRSDLPINKSALRSFRRAMSCWGDTIVDGIHDRLAALRVRQTDN